MRPNDDYLMTNGIINIILWGLLERNNALGEREGRQVSPVIQINSLVMPKIEMVVFILQYLQFLKKNSLFVGE